MFPSDEIIVHSGASCSASSVYDDRFLCTNVLDGSIKEWATRFELTGSWIWIQLDQNYYITRVDLSGRCYLNRSPQTVLLRFSDASTQTVHSSTFNQYIYVNFVHQTVGKLHIRYRGAFGSHATCKNCNLCGLNDGTMTFNNNVYIFIEVEQLLYEIINILQFVSF